MSATRLELTHHPPREVIDVRVNLCQVLILTLPGHPCKVEDGIGGMRNTPLDLLSWQHRYDLVIAPSVYPGQSYVH
jgi:hypothetical protein